MGERQRKKAREKEKRKEKLRKRDKVVRTRGKAEMYRREAKKLLNPTRKIQ
jgi:hypothetical protein